MAANKKVEDSVLVESYSRLKSVWKVGKEVGLCGQSVNERLIKMGIQNSMNVLSEDDRLTIINEYDYYASRGEVYILAKKLNRTRHILSKYARELGLTSYKRDRKQFIGYYTQARRDVWKNNSHPRGMSGKKHSKETLKVLSETSKINYQKLRDQGRDREVAIKAIKTRVERYGSAAPPRHKVSWKQGWRIIGERTIYFRSSWEANYARFLEKIKTGGCILEWGHEVDAFYFDTEIEGSVMFLPDFKITHLSGDIEYHEVKGWFDKRSVETLERMRKYYPDIKLTVICSKWYNKNRKELSKTIEGWEK